MDINVRWVSESSDFINDFDKIEKKIEDVTEEFEDLNKEQEKTFKDIGKDAAKLQTTMDKTAQSVNGIDRGMKDINTTGGKFRQWISNGVKDLNVFGVNIGKATANLKAKQAALRGVTSGLGGAVSGFKALRLAIVATGIGALLIAFTSLATLLTRSQRGLDLVSRVTAGLSSIFDNVIERAARLGDTLYNLFSGNIGLNQAITEAKAAFSGLGEEIREDAIAAFELERATQQLIKSQRALKVEFANQRAEIEQLRNLARDETKSFTERQQAIEKAISIENELEQKRITNAKENLRIIKEKNSLGESFNDDLDAEAEAEVTLANIRAESDQRRRRDLQLAQSLQKQYSAERQKQLDLEAKALLELEKEYQSLFDQLTKQASDAELGSLTGVEKLAAERTIAVSQVEQLKTQLKAAAEAIGKDVDVEAIAASLLGNINQAFKDEINELRGDSSELSALPTAIEDILNQPIEPKLNINFDTPDNRTLFQKIKDDLFTSLGLTSEDEELFNFLANNVKDIFSSFSDAFSGSVDAEIANNERLIESLDRQVQKAEEALSDQLELKKEGLANDYELEKENIEKLNIQREEAEKQRAELEAKAARRRLLADAASQVSSLITSAANVIKAESNKGILGVALAIGGIAAFFRIFQQFKANAASQVQGFREGTNYVKGPGGHKSDSVPANLSVGEKVFKWEHSEALNKAGLFRNEDAVKYALMGKESEKHFNNPFNRASTKIVKLNKKQAKAEVLASMTKTDFEEMLDKAITKKIVKAIEDRPHHFSNTGKGSFVVKTGKYEKSTLFIEP